LPEVGDITIAIPTFNRSGWLSRTLNSLADLALPPGTRAGVLIINNACTDNTPAVIEEISRHFPFPLRTVVEEQQGLCFARNRALRETSAAHVIFFDDDIEVAPEWLIGYVEAVARYDADAVVGPVFPLFEKSPPSYYGNVALDSLTSAYSRKGEQTMLLPSETAHQIPGCNFGVRRAAALEVGGFDPHLDRIGRGMVGHGDWEFGYALARSGKRVVYEPRCRVAHCISADKLRLTSLAARWYGFGAAERFLMARHGKTFPRWSSGRSALRAAQFLGRALWAAAGGRRAAALEQYLKACREWGYARGLNAASTR
jgi:glycosyltransferase involved in cell wall biosynthesis